MHTLQTMLTLLAIVPQQIVQEVVGFYSAPSVYQGYEYGRIEEKGKGAYQRMIVHFMASASRITENIEDLREIVSIIHQEGHTLAINWVEPAYVRAKKGIRPTIQELRDIYKENSAALARSDVFITEATLPSFGTGYQIGRSKKPTLILRKENSLLDMTAGITEKHIELRSYKNTASLKNIISDFLRRNDISTKDLRFNFSIDRRIHNYLRWASFKTGETKAEVIRSLIEREIDKEDGGQ